MLVKKHNVDEGRIDGRVCRVEITSDRQKWAVVEAVLLSQGRSIRRLPVLSNKYRVPEQLCLKPS